MYRTETRELFCTGCALPRTVNITNLSCRLTSNILHTGRVPRSSAASHAYTYGCIGKDFHFPDPDPYDLQVLYTGPNGYNSTSIHATIPNVHTSDRDLPIEKYPYLWLRTCSDTIHLKVFPGY
jgi:hypothetical protein